ncbi:hypothetical protein BKA56DRAFT_611305 [Ilyonectria sp. MPI-CAGE-AT-0026]|nr:hypothetical protein BKA56DRAFT_611305 [Ilyonectria sp. MPI-CAGE-AT-0026]
MAINYDDAPEVAPLSAAPEVYTPGMHQTSGGQSPVVEAEKYSGYSSPPNYNPTPVYPNAYGSYQQLQPQVKADTASIQPPTSEPEKKQKDEAKRGICGCSLLVLVLSAIIAVLSVVVIGLAAGTGIASNNYNDASLKLEALSSSYSSILGAAATASTPSSASSGFSFTSTSTSTSSSAAATATGYSNITNGCSDDEETTTGKMYTSKFYDKTSYTMYCHRDTPNAPLFSLFAGDFNGCMEACTAWNSYPETNGTTCEAVSFIPYWSVIANAKEGGAPGDCYLKPGPQSKGDLSEPDIGAETEYHCALRED